MHGGTVQAASAGEGQGATFRVRLPLMIVHPEDLDVPREHPRTERMDRLAGLGDLRGIRVLAVDDEEDALTLLRVVLETAGAEVTTVARRPWRWSASPPYGRKCWSIDLGMPEMDGFELIAGSVPRATPTCAMSRPRR